MAPEAWGTAIAAILTGLTGVIVALSGYRRTRDTHLREDLDQCWEREQVQRSRFLAALEHIGRLEELLAGNRVRIPMRPVALDLGRTDAQPTDWQPRHAAA